jgi:hypothetical protein
MAMATTYEQVQIVLPSAMAGVTGEGIGYLLEESYENTMDNVQVEHSEDGSTAKIIFDGTWTCTVKFKESVLAEPSPNSDGKQALVTPTKAIEVVCDPDPNETYRSDYRALVALLRQLAQ